MMIKPAHHTPFVNLFLFVCGQIELAELKRACTFPRMNQAATLRRILESARDTVYGREHNFDVILQAGTPEKLFELYRKYNPPSEYENYRPFVERMMAGENDVLFPGKPVLYGTTSGSTGQPKFVPISAVYLKNVYGRMTRLWIYNFIRHRRKTFNGAVLTVAGKREEGRTPDGTVFGSVSGFLQATAPRVVRDSYAVPQPVYDIEDYSARNYAIMRFALERDVTVWIAPNPSTVLELQNNVDKWLDEFIEDIGNGTLTGKVDIPDGIRDALRPYLKPNVDRAFELRALQSQYDRVLPRHYWPNLQLLSTWKCGNTQIYLRKMANFFPDALFHQELGYFATECRAGLVLDSGNDSILMPHFHFYEFKREKDLDNPDAPFYLLYELKEGERYCPFVTTFSGLYRYNMNDVVQASSSFLNSPKIRMIRKVNGIVSITGEKLYEDQFVQAVVKAQEVTGMRLNFYTGYVNLPNSRYDWYFEFEDGRVNQKKAELFAAEVDAQLKSLNIEYESKRNSFRLKNPAVYILQPNAFLKFKKMVMDITRRDSSRFKPNVLAQDEKKHALIDRLRKK